MIWVLAVITGVLMVIYGISEPDRKRSNRIIKSSYRRPLERISDIPTDQGVYKLFNGAESNPVYIGKTNNLTRRIREHQRNPSKKFDQISYHITPPGVKDCLEKDLINRYNPPLNKINGSCPLN